MRNSNFDAAKGNFLDNNGVLDMSQFEVQLYFPFQ